MSRRRFAFAFVLLAIAVATAVVFARRDEPRDDAASGIDGAPAAVAPAPLADASGLASPGRRGLPGRISYDIGALAAANASSVRSTSTRSADDPDRSLLLRVFDGDGHTVVVGAEVLVEADGTKPTSGVTDARGEFRVAAIPRAVTSLHVGAEPRLPLVVRDVKPGTIEVVLRAVTEVRGLVVDERDQSPIAGARIRAVAGWGGSDASKPLFETTTDEAGHFSAKMPSDDYLRIIVDLPDGRRYETFSSPRSQRGVVVAYVPVGGRIVGRVLACVDQPMGAFAMVVARTPDDPRWSRTVNTVGNGEFLLAGIDPARSYTVHAENFDGSRSAPAEGVRLGPNGVVEVVLQLVAPGTVLVELTDEVGSPVPGAHVALDAGRYQGVEVVGTASVHRLEAVPVGRHRLHVDSSLGTGLDQEIDVVTGPSRIPIRLDAGIRVDGDVVDGKGLPVAGTHVTLEREPVENEPAVVRTATADAQGRFAFGGLTVGAWRLSATAPGAATAKPIALTAPRRGVRVTLVRLGRVRGRLVRASGGVLTGDVEIRRSRGDDVSSQTDTLVDGAFAVEGFDAEGETIEIVAEGFAPVKREVHVPAEGELDLGAITMTAGHRVAGVVVDGHGGPVEGAVVLVAHHGRTVTDPNGRFAFDGVPPGPLPIVVLGARFLPKSIEVAADASSALRIELSSGAHVEGTVVGADGQGVGGLPLAIVPTGGSSSAEPAAALRTDEDGTFDVRVPPGRYRIEAKEDGATAATFLADLTLTDGDEQRPTLVFKPR